MHKKIFALLLALFCSAQSAGAAELLRNACVPPQIPPVYAAQPDTPAEALNEAVDAYNRFAAESKAYMDCLARQGQAEAVAASQRVLQQTQAQIDAQAAQVQRLYQSLPPASRQP